MNHDFPLAMRWSVPALPASVAATRKRIVAQLRLWGVPLEADSVGTLELLASEAVTNAIRHGHGTTIEIALAARPGTVLLAVTDDSVTEPALRHANADEESGRGMFLVQALATRWGCVPEVIGKTVWLTLELPKRPEHAAFPLLPTAINAALTDRIRTFCALARRHLTPGELTA